MIWCFCGILLGIFVVFCLVFLWQMKYLIYETII